MTPAFQSWPQALFLWSTCEALFSLIPILMSVRSLLLLSWCLPCMMYVYITLDGSDVIIMLNYFCLLYMWQYRKSVEMTVVELICRNGQKGHKIVEFIPCNCSKLHLLWFTTLNHCNSLSDSCILFMHRFGTLMWPFCVCVCQDWFSEIYCRFFFHCYYSLLKIKELYWHLWFHEEPLTSMELFHCTKGSW